MGRILSPGLWSAEKTGMRALLGMRVRFVVAAGVAAGLLTVLVLVKLAIGGWHHWQSDRQTRDILRQARTIKEQTATIQTAAHTMPLPADFITVTTFRTVQCYSTSFVMGCWTNSSDEATVVSELRQAMTAAGLSNPAATCSANNGVCRVVGSTDEGELEFNISPISAAQATSARMYEIRALALPRDL